MSGMLEQMLGQMLKACSNFVRTEAAKLLKACSNKCSDLLVAGRQHHAMFCQDLADLARIGSVLTEVCQHEPARFEPELANLFVQPLPKLAVAQRNHV